jgi:uncharacterized protein DUF2397
MSKGPDAHSSEDDFVVPTQPGDGRSVVIYLVARESAQYIAIMDVLEASVTDLTPREMVARLAAVGAALSNEIVEARLEKLREWGAVSARTDTSRILRHADLLARNWRYTATTAGRHVQRFYRKVLAGTPTVREIPLSSLARVVETAESLASTPQVGPGAADAIGRLFISHDDLDAALVGAEDSLAGLADRFDLTDASTAELKALLVGYATHVASELERGSARAFRALSALRSRFAELAATAVSASDARALIERGALAASHGGRVEDWEGLLAWFDPSSGRSTRFSLRLVRALPGMHINLRRLHSSSGTATSRARALALARACVNPSLGTAIWFAAVGDHSWRKLYGEADDDDLSRIRAWREGPQVEVPELLRFTGRAGARGGAPAARDDTAAREAVNEARERRRAQHDQAVREVLLASPGTTFSEHAARVALASLAAAVRSMPSKGRRTGVRDGLACTLFDRASESGSLRASAWRVLTPGRIAVFHQPGTDARPPGTESPRVENAAGGISPHAGGGR